VGVQGSAAFSRRNGRRRKAEAAKLEQSDGVRAGVLAGRVWSVTARLSKRSRAARSPRAPGLADRAAGSAATEAAGRPTGAGLADPPRGIKRSDCRDRAAVEASPAACRAQRRAGARSAGADVTERNEVQRRNDGDGADISGAPFRAGHCTAHTAARPDRTLPDRSRFNGGGRKQGE